MIFLNKDEKKPVEAVITWIIILAAVFLMGYNVASKHTEPINQYSNPPEDPRR